MTYWSSVLRSIKIIIAMQMGLGEMGCVRLPDYITMGIVFFWTGHKLYSLVHHMHRRQHFMLENKILAVPLDYLSNLFMYS